MTATHDPKFDDHLHLAIELHNNEEHTKAASLYEEILSAEPDHTDALKLRGKLFYDCGDYTNAIKLLEKSQSLSPNEPTTLFYLGEAYDANDDPDQAISAYLKLIKVEPDSLEGRYNLAILYYQIDSFENAIGYFNSITDQNPDHEDSWNYLGLIYQEQNNYKEAEKCFSQALRANPDCTEAHINLGNLLAEQQSFEKAEDHLLSARDLDPDNTDVLFNLAILFQNQDQIETAIEYYQMVLDLDPEHLDSHNNLGLLHEVRTDQDQAMACYQKAIAIDTSYPNAWFNLGNLYHCQGKADEALHCYQTIIEHDPENISAQYLIDAISGNQKSQAPDAYVSDLFDSFAENFEKSLIEELEYQTPSLLSQMLWDIHEDEPWFENVLDLGCGTGLMGEEICEYCDFLTGIDLSKGMLAKAEIKAVYDELHQSELVSFLENSDDTFDLITATDVFVYIGDLAPVFKAVSQTLCEEGLFLFSTEKGGMEDFIITPTGRFRHATHYILGLAEKYGLSLLDHRQDIVRKEKGEDVDGDLFLFELR